VEMGVSQLARWSCASEAPAYSRAEAAHAAPPP